jgi:hypothetical protein
MVRSSASTPKLTSRRPETGYLCTTATITQVVVYLGPVYEVNATTGVTTSYYAFGGQRVAMRQGAVVY